MRRSLLGRACRGPLVLVGLGARAQAYPAVPVQLGHEPLQPVPLLAGRAAALITVVGTRRGGRHHQPGRRRRVPARPVGAARRGWRSGLTSGCAALSNDVGGAESPEVAAFPMQADSTRASLRRAFSLNVTVGARGVVRPPDRRSAAGLGRRPAHDVARALPDVAAERDGPVRARRPLLRAVRPALRRAHLLRARYTGYNLYEETYNAVGRLRRRRLGGARHRVHAVRRSASRLRCSRSASGRERRRRRTARSASRDGRAGPASARRHRPARRRATRAARSASSGSSRRSCCSSARPTSSASSSAQRGYFGQNQFVSYLGATFFPIARSHGSAWPTSASRRICRSRAPGATPRRRGQLLPLGALRAGRLSAATSSSGPAPPTTSDRVALDAAAALLSVRGAMAKRQSIRVLSLAGSAAVLARWVWPGAPLYPSAPSDPAYDTDVRPIFLAHCTRCHGNGPNGGSINIPPGASSQGYPPVGCYTQFGVNKSVSPDGGVCYSARSPTATTLIPTCTAPTRSTRCLLRPRRGSTATSLPVIDAWVAELPIPNCSNSSHPNPALFCPDGGT